MTVKFEIELELDQESITDNEIEAVIDGLLNVIPGGFAYGDDEFIIVESTMISKIG